ncbi:MAG TPA: DUF1127 domain-containing protein [Phenylobacterium sp.]|jgi:uncharacterized protein YjiS (DUF1127 family)|nr:DUF1127 domain-containing protein [Phenylobacterium sp.]HZY52445.1 DUF1127 domain-containing protein [Reyranella sp.]
MSTLSSVREIARTDVPSFSFGRALALVAGSVVVGVEALFNRAEVRKSRRQLAELDDRLLRDIGLDRGTARFEASKGFWA